MKSINLFTGVLLLLVGFWAGIAFNLIPISTAAQGPPEPPPAALKSVAHDATLAGNGTAASPLGIANGGVTAPKLSAAAPPTLGQVLGFNGANLEWQNTPVGGVRVVDSRGQVVGPFIGYPEGSLSAVMLRINNRNFVFPITPAGFNFSLVPFQQYFFTTSNCSGARYLQGSNPPLYTFVRDGVFGTEMVYAGEPLQEIIANTMQNRYSDGSTQCLPFTQPTRMHVNPSVTFDISTLGFVPPFHLEF